MNPERGIDAVDLSSGKLLWSTSNAAKPLLLDGRRLIAQAESAGPKNGLRIAILDTGNAGRVLHDAVVFLPEGVHTAINDGLGTKFRTSARMQGDDALVSWRFSRQPMIGGGAELRVKGGYRTVTGAVRINLPTGRAETETIEGAQSPSTPEIALPEAVVRALAAEQVREPIWEVGDKLALIRRSREKGQQHIIVRRWDRQTGRELPQLRLFGDGFTFRYSSADGRYLLGSKIVDGPLWTWRIVSISTGELVAEVPNPSPGAWFFLTGSSLIHEARPTGKFIGAEWVGDQPLTLRALGVQTGKELWVRPFRDTAYRGPYPPRRP